jgi:hypothetical protein
MRQIKLAMAALAVLAVVAAVGTVAITSTARVENVWHLKACTKGAPLDQIRCCDFSDGVLQDNGKCVAPPPDSGPPGSQHDLSDIGSETLTPSPLRTHDPSDIGTQTFTPVPVSTPQPSPPAPPSTTWVPPTNPCMNPLEPVCAG